LAWVMIHKDQAYPEGFLNAEFAKEGGYEWLNDVRAANIAIPNSVAEYDFNMKPADGYTDVYGIADVEGSANAVKILKWRIEGGGISRSSSLTITPKQDGGFVLFGPGFGKSGEDVTLELSPGSDFSFADMPGFPISKSVGSKYQTLSDFAGILGALFGAKGEAESDLLDPQPGRTFYDTDMSNLRLRERFDTLIRNLEDGSSERVIRRTIKEDVMTGKYIEFRKEYKRDTVNDGNGG